MSRDFSLFGYVPTWVMNRTPALVYQTEESFFLLDFGIFAKIACFHWIHFLVPYPSESLIQLIWLITILALALTIFFGRGKNRIFVITAYIGVMYLWGFVFTSGQEIDAVFLPMGILFCYLFSNHNESLNLKILSEKSTESSVFISSAIMVFVIYYLGAGINKLTDIPLIEWLQYDLFKEMQYYVYADRLGSDRLIPSIFHSMVDQHIPFISTVVLLGVPAVYIMHLLVPLVFTSKLSLMWSFFFYALFHFLAFGVGISFVANLVIWFGFLNISNILKFKTPILGYK